MNINDGEKEKSVINKKQETMLELVEGKSSAQAPLLSVNFNESMLTKHASKSFNLIKPRKKPMKWSEMDTRTFYKCLEIFGMDFSMIKEVLSHKTQRQILRKFHREKKRDPLAIERALFNHESNLIQKDAQCHSFLENIFRQTSDSDFFSDNFSDDSLNNAVDKKLRFMVEKSMNPNDMDYDDEPIQPLDFYLKE